MKRAAGIAVALLCAASGLRAEPAPPADSLLRACVDALPDIPLLIRGDLVARSRAGSVDRKLLVDMTLDWQADPPTARYTTRDAFGRGLEHLSITWPRGEPVEYRFFSGDPLTAAPIPPLDQPIEGTDISWQDLSLSFLWWPGGKTVGREDVRGRDCWIVDLPGAAGGVRAWIDPKIPVLLRAETWDAQGERRVRRMDVKGFKKINGRWVIQNIEVESFPSRHKTVLTIRDVQDRARGTFIKTDDGGEEEPVDRVSPVALPQDGESESLP